MEQIPGIEFDFGGGRRYVLAPLAFGALQRLQAPLQALDGSSILAPDGVKTVLQTVHASLCRNYPDITYEQVGELVDVANVYEILNCVLDLAGIKRKEVDDAKNQTAQPAMPQPTGPA